MANKPDQSPIYGYVCNVCVYKTECSPGKAAANTEQIIDMLSDIEARLARIESSLS